MALRILHLICGHCGAGVNKVEYDPDAAAAKVQAAASTLGVDPALLAAHVTDPETDARDLAACLANPTDSPCPTAGCPGGDVKVSN